MTTSGQHPAPRATTPHSSDGTVPDGTTPATSPDPLGRGPGTTPTTPHTLVVLGASRGTGALVVELALAAGHRVRAVSRSGTGSAPARRPTPSMRPTPPPCDRCSTARTRC